MLHSANESKPLRLLCLGLLFLLVTGSVSAADQQQRPNIILILADDLGLPGLSCYGGTKPTPQLDALAKQGTRFSFCFSAPLCGPSRAMLMSGRYAFRTGVISNGHGAAMTPDKDGCVALLLKQAGYKTALAGKWRQLSQFTTQADATRWGFDEFLVWGTTLPDSDVDDGSPKREQKNQPNRYWDPEFNLNGKIQPMTEGKYGPDVLQEFALDFIQRHQDQPFFLYYPTPLIHGPILKTPDSKPDSGRQEHYADNLRYLDKQVGQLVAELDRLKLSEKTLLLFIGDNGSVPVGMLHGQTVDGNKGKLTEGGVRVPCLARWPGTVPAGRLSHDLIDFTDFLPTFVELAGAPLPTGRTLDGRSFAPQLRGETGKPRDWVYVHLNQQRYVRSKQWKLTANGELFDMQDAPYKQRLVDPDKLTPEAAAAKKSLQEALEQLQPPAGAEIPAVKKKKKKV